MSADPLVLDRAALDRLEASLRKHYEPITPAGEK